VPYDPPAHGRRESLAVQVEAGHGEPDRLYVLGRPRDGVVVVRETVGGLAPRDYTERADALRERFERAQHERRRISVDLYLIQRWLDGQV
jgi:hypothetical protein